MQYQAKKFPFSLSLKRLIRKKLHRKYRHYWHNCVHKAKKDNCMFSCWIQCFCNIKNWNTGCTFWSWLLCKEKNSSVFLVKCTHFWDWIHNCIMHNAVSEITCTSIFTGLPRPIRPLNCIMHIEIWYGCNCSRDNEIVTEFRMFQFFYVLAKIAVSCVGVKCSNFLPVHVHGANGAI